MGILAKSEAEAAIVPYGAVDKPHRHDKADRAQHSYWWEVLNGIKSVVLQYRESCGVRQSQRRHIESNAQRVHAYEQALVRQLVAEAGRKAHIPAAQHGSARYQMADAQEALRLNILVGHDTHQRGHKD